MSSDTSLVFALMLIMLQMKVLIALFRRYLYYFFEYHKTPQQDIENETDKLPFPPSHLHPSCAKIICLSVYESGPQSSKSALNFVENIGPCVSKIYVKFGYFVLCLIFFFGQFPIPCAQYFCQTFRKALRLVYFRLRRSLGSFSP